MNFLSTGVKEITRRLRRSKNRLALANARKGSTAPTPRSAGIPGANSSATKPETSKGRSPTSTDSTRRSRPPTCASPNSKARSANRKAARESARRDHSQVLAAIDEEREPVQERLATLQASLAEHQKVLDEQNRRKHALDTTQTALLKQERRARRQGLLLTEEERAERQRPFDAERARLAEEAAHLAASRSEAGEPMAADQAAIKEVKGALAAFDARAQRARTDLAARDRAAALAIAGLHKEIAAIRRQVAHTEDNKEDAYLAIGRRLAEREDGPARRGRTLRRQCPRSGSTWSG